MTTLTLELPEQLDTQLTQLQNGGAFRKIVLPKKHCKTI